MPNVYTPDDLRDARGGEKVCVMKDEDRYGPCMGLGELGWAVSLSAKRLARPESGIVRTTVGQTGRRLLRT